jgi:prepilin-type N-terminal cleavage/methylation domain-containing protein
MRRRGFTLLEVLIALALLAIGIVGVLGVVTGCLARSRDNADRARATALAQRRLTELTLDPELAPGVEEGDFAGAAAPADDDDENARFRWRTTVEATAQDGLYHLRATVTWTVAAGERAVELETCYAPNVLTTTPAGGGGGGQGGGEEPETPAPASPSSSSSSPPPSSPSSSAASPPPSARRAGTPRR